MESGLSTVGVFVNGDGWKLSTTSDIESFNQNQSMQGGVFMLFFTLV